MRKKFFYFSFFFIACVIIYLFVKTYDFHKYFNKIETQKTIPNFRLENMLNPDLKIKYLKSFYYDKKCIGFNAIIDDKYYVTVVKLGKSHENLKFQKIGKNHEKNNVITLPPIDVDEQISRYINFENYPFDIQTIGYYIDGQELQILNANFPEIVFKANYVNLSFNSKNKIDFIYSTPVREMSLSFINYKNELYLINAQAYKNQQFKSLHSLLTRNN